MLKVRWVEFDPERDNDMFTGDDHEFKFDQPHSPLFMMLKAAISRINEIEHFTN